MLIYKMLMGQEIFDEFEKYLTIETRDNLEVFVNQIFRNDVEAVEFVIKKTEIQAKYFVLI